MTQKFFSLALKQMEKIDDKTEIENASRFL